MRKTTDNRAYIVKNDPSWFCGYVRSFFETYSYAYSEHCIIDECDYDIRHEEFFSFAAKITLLLNECFMRSIFLPYECESVDSAADAISRSVVSVFEERLGYSFTKSSECGDSLETVLKILKASVKAVIEYAIDQRPKSVYSDDV